VQPKATTSRTQPLSVQKLHAVLQPRVTKPVRSTKPLTLPDDIELETDKRLANRAAAGAAAQEQVGCAVQLGCLRKSRHGAAASLTAAVLFQAGTATPTHVVCHVMHCCMHLNAGTSASPLLC
jgi:hypothetical protein